MYRTTDFFFKFPLFFTCKTTKKGKKSQKKFFVIFLPYFETYLPWIIDSNSIHHFIWNCLTSSVYFSWKDRWNILQGQSWSWYFLKETTCIARLFFHRYIYFRKLNMILTTKVNMTSLILIWLFLLLLLELENKCEQSDDGKIWKRNIHFWITFGVQFFKWKARQKKWYVFCFLLRYYTSSVFVIFWSQSTFLTKTKGGKANVLNNSKILRRSFFSKI